MLTCSSLWLIIPLLAIVIAYLKVAIEFFSYGVMGFGIAYLILSLIAFSTIITLIIFPILTFSSLLFPVMLFWFIYKLAGYAIEIVLDTYSFVKDICFDFKINTIQKGAVLV